MSGFDWDESQWPLVRVKMHAQISEEDYRRLHDRFRELLQRRQLCALISDSRLAPPSTPLQRKQTADMLTELNPLAQRYMVATGVVLSSAVQRGILTAILWVRPMSHPLEVFSTPQDAERWALEQLRARGVLRRESAGSRPA